jgi:hypothetical protein
MTDKRLNQINLNPGPRLAKNLADFYEAFELAYGQKVKKVDFLRYAINAALNNRDRTMKELSKTLI